MAWLSLVSFGFLVALELQGAYGSTKTNMSGEKVTRVDCTKEMNAERAKAGFPPLFPATKSQYQFPIEVVDDRHLHYLSEACVYVNQEHVVGHRFAYGRGILIYAHQSKDELNCGEAIDYLKKAYENFNGPPPPFSKAEALYGDPRNLGFLAIFSPGRHTIECALVTCPRTEQVPRAIAGVAAQQPQKTSTKRDKSEAESPQDTNGKPATLTRLYCETRPLPFVGGKAPFTEAQWQKVTGVMTGVFSSASAPSPAYFVLAAAAFIMYLF